MWTKLNQSCKMIEKDESSPTWCTQRDCICEGQSKHVVPFSTYLFIHYPDLQIIMFSEQGLKKVMFSYPERVDFLVGWAIFHSYMPNVQGLSQFVCQLNHKIGKLKCAQGKQHLRATVHVLVWMANWIIAIFLLVLRA